MKKLSVAFILGGIVLVAGLFLLSALINMLLVNVILHQYHATPLTYNSALAGTALLAIVGGSMKTSTSRDSK